MVRMVRLPGEQERKDRDRYPARGGRGIVAGPQTGMDTGCLRFRGGSVLAACPDLRRNLDRGKGVRSKKSIQRKIGQQKLNRVTCSRCGKGGGFIFSGGGEVFLVVGFREEGEESPSRARLVAPHQIFDSGLPDAALEEDAEVPAGARPPVVDRAVDRTADLSFEGGAPGMTPVRPLHAESESRQVVRQFGGDSAAALLVRLAPVKGDPEGGAARPAGQTWIAVKAVAVHR